MGRALGFRRIVATALVTAAAGAGFAIGAGSAGGQVPRPEPNCTVPGDAAEAIIIEPPTREVACATLRVTKVVHGTAPAGTTFTVIVQCSSTDPDRTRAQQLPPGHTEPFTEVLTFPETGGTQDVLIALLSSCTVSEAPPGPGCALASVTPETTQITGPQVFPVFVTNNCEPPAPSTVNIQGTIVVNEPATPVVVRPRFTG
jgi:hypothetical protein